MSKLCSFPKLRGGVCDLNKSEVSWDQDVKSVLNPFVRQMIGSVLRCVYACVLV